MTCRECEDLLLEVSRRRSAPTVERAVEAHAASCEACAGRLERQRAVSLALRGLAEHDAASSSSPGLEAQLMAAFVAHRRGAQTTAEPAESPRTPARWLALAAGLMLSVAGLTWWVSRPVPLVRQAAQIGSQDASAAAPHAGTAARPSAAPQVVGTEVAAAVPATRLARSARRPVPPAPVRPTGFVPIPAAAGLPDFESGEIVRMGIAVTSLPNYGLEIPDDPPDARVQADFLVGQDGQARAIRLVSSISDDPRPRR